MGISKERKSAYDKEYRARRKAEKGWTDRQHYQANKEHILKRTQNWRLLRKYGITTAQRDEMLAQQNYACAICHRVELRRGKNLCVDHNHANDKLRGILCHNCNSGLGLFLDNPDTLRAAADYIEKHAANYKNNDFMIEE